MERSCFNLAFVLLLQLMSSTKPSLATSLVTDQNALLALKNTITSDPYGVLAENWSRKSYVCYWTGVSCGVKHQRVVSLNISSFALSGTLPPHLGNITFLRYFDIGDNNFTGTIPSEMSCLHRLRVINMRSNSFAGKIPSWFGAFPQLVQLSLYNNTFSGIIPPSLFNCSSLQHVSLVNNQLTGSIPNDMCNNLPNLRILALSENQIEGQIPRNVWKCRELEILSLSYNHFSGEIPSEIGSLSMLRELYLRKNDFKGHMSKQIANCTFLVKLSLSQNSFTGEIPPSLLNISTLQLLALWDNQLTGSLPADLGYRLPNLRLLWLSENNFTSNSDSEFSSFITSMANCRYLKGLSVANNPLINGILPASIGNLSTSLQYFGVNNCNLTSTIPEEIGNLSQVNQLMFHSNRLIGQIPYSICNLEQLNYLHLSNNSLEGPIPECLTANLTKSLFTLHLKGNRLKGPIPTTFAHGCLLESLNLNGNNLEGIVPRSMAECRNLEVVDIGNNGIKDEFPFWVQTLPDLRVLVLKSNRFHGPILHPPKTNNLNNSIPFPKLQVFDISGNAFTGFLPSAYFNSFRAMINVKENTTTTDDTNWFTSYQEPMVFVLKGVRLELDRILTTFTTIDFSCNKFNGSIPQSIGGLNSLRYLNLSHNRFIGYIPASLGNAKSIIESLDLSSNQLVGPIPWSLTKLPSLSKFNLSRNNLSGTIPQSISGQFSTFDNTSYMENTELCGSPLTRICQEDNLQPSVQMSPPQSDDGSGFFDGFCWQVVVLGYGCGFILGVIMGCVIFRHERTKCLSGLFSTARYKKKPNRRGNLARRKT